MLAQGNARICLLGDHCGISTTATFCHVQHFISTFLQPTKRDRPILHTSSGDPPALQHRRTSHNRRARRRGRSGLSGVNGHGPALAAEVGGSGQTPGGALHRRGQRAGLSGGGKPGRSGASPLLLPPHGLTASPHRTEKAAAPLPGGHFPREPRPPRGSSPTPVLTALRSGDAAQPPRRAASASARRGRRAAPGGAAPPAGGEEAAPAAPSTAGHGRGRRLAAGRTGLRGAWGWDVQHSPRGQGQARCPLHGDPGHTRCRLHGGRAMQAPTHENPSVSKIGLFFPSKKALPD